MDRLEKIILISDILDYSDIVWPKYGSETTMDLAEKIVNHLEENAENRD